MPLPIDFEKLVKLPKTNGYPYSIRAEDLMRNFAHCDLLPSDSGDAIRVELVDVVGQTAKHGQRKIRISGFTAKRVWICENGVPVEYEILTRPLT